MAETFSQVVEDKVCRWHRGGDQRLIRGRAQQPRCDDALKADHVADALEQIPVADIHDLIHPHGGARIGGG